MCWDSSWVGVNRNQTEFHTESATVCSENYTENLECYQRHVSKKIHTTQANERQKETVTHKSEKS